MEEKKEIRVESKIVEENTSWPVNSLVETVSWVGAKPMIAGLCGACGLAGARIVILVCSSHILQQLRDPLSILRDLNSPDSSISLDCWKRYHKTSQVSMIEMFWCSSP